MHLAKRRTLAADSRRKECLQVGAVPATGGKPSRRNIGRHYMAEGRTLQRLSAVHLPAHTARAVDFGSVTHSIGEISPARPVSRTSRRCIRQRILEEQPV